MADVSIHCMQAILCLLIVSCHAVASSHRAELTVQEKTSVGRRVADLLSVVFNIVKGNQIKTGLVIKENKRNDLRNPDNDEEETIKEYLAAMKNTKRPWYDSAEYKKHKHHHHEHYSHEHGKHHKKHYHGEKEYYDSYGSEENDYKVHIKLPVQDSREKDNKVHIKLPGVDSDENKKHIIVNPFWGANERNKHADTQWSRYHKSVQEHGIQEDTQNKPGFLKRLWNLYKEPNPRLH